MAGFALTPAILLLAALVVGRPLPARPDQPADGGPAMVSAVIDGDTVMLADGRQLRLAGIAAPKRPLDRPDDSPWPLADAARSALAGLVLGSLAGRHIRVRGWLRSRYGPLIEATHPEQIELLAP